MIATTPPPIRYLNALFNQNDIVCLTFIHGTKKYASGAAVTENEFVPLSEVTTDAGIKRLTERNKLWHIHVSMAPFKVGSKNRTKANVAEARHVFVESRVRDCFYGASEESSFVFSFSKLGHE